MTPNPPNRHAQGVFTKCLGPRPPSGVIRRTLAPNLPREPECFLFSKKLDFENTSWDQVLLSCQFAVLLWSKLSAFDDEKPGALIMGGLESCRICTVQLEHSSMPSRMMIRRRKSRADWLRPASSSCSLPNIMFA
jgi:hypothetical protein